LNIVC